MAERLTSDQAQALIQNLEENRRHHLGRLSLSQVVDFLGAVSEKWLDPQYARRREAVPLICQSSGFSASMVERGLEVCFQALRKESLQSLINEEFKSPFILEGFQSYGANNFALARGITPSLQILAGAVPSVAARAMYSAFLVRSACLIKPASDEPHFASLLLQSMAEVDKNLASSMAVATWPGGDESFENELFDAVDLVVVYGTDKTVEQVRKRVKWPALFMGYGQQVSLGLISREALKKGVALEELARKAAMDVAWYDQQGCLSPHMIYVEEGGEVRPEEFADLLASALQKLVKDLPPGNLSVESAAAVRHVREQYEFKKFGGAARVHASPDLAGYTVIYEENSDFELSPLHRVIRVKPLPDLFQLRPLLIHWRRRLQAVAFQAGPDRRNALAALLADLGVKRLCAFGAMQDPPLLWHHDGRPNLADWVRWLDYERG